MHLLLTLCIFINRKNCPILTNYSLSRYCLYDVFVLYGMEPTASDPLRDLLTSQLNSTASICNFIILMESYNAHTYLSLHCFTSAWSESREIRREEVAEVSRWSTSICYFLKVENIVSETNCL